ARRQRRTPCPGRAQPRRAARARLRRDRRIRRAASVSAMDHARYFSRDFAEARERFRDLARRHGLEVETYPHPERGPDGGDLSADVTRIGPADAEAVLLLVSGTHGVEGFCGSGCQLGMLHQGTFDALPEGMAVVLVHAINPYGFAWLQRLTEGHVDLNRNF